ncbi:MAG: hypothetical protein U9Q15_04745 [Patescibacteria group bacterium]|nr:hypothetical protein [Patescibacteria group bacterium]
MDEDAALFYRHDYSFQETNASNHIRHSCRIDDRKDLDISTRFVISCTFKSYYHDSLVSEKSLQFSFWQ